MMRNVGLFSLLSGVAAVAVQCLLSSPAYAADENAAKALARQNNCFNCHAVDKKKVGPAWHDVAVKYKSDKDAEAKLIKRFTTGEKAKFDDGHIEDHPTVKAKSPDEIKNLADWILSL